MSCSVGFNVCLIIEEEADEAFFSTLNKELYESLETNGQTFATNISDTPMESRLEFRTNGNKGDTKVSLLLLSLVVFSHFIHVKFYRQEWRILFHCEFTDTEITRLQSFVA